MPPERFLARPRRTLLLAGIVLALVVVWAFVVPHGTRTIDRRRWEWMEDTWSYGLGHAARFLAWVGGYGRGLVVVLLALPLVARRRWLGLGVFAAVEALTPLTTALPKAISGQVRPGVVAGGAWGWSLALFAIAQLAASSSRYASALPGSMNHSK